MNQFLTLCMVVMLVSSALFSGQTSHCYGDACGTEMEHAFSDHSHDRNDDHDNDQAQQESDAEDADGKLANSHLHGWHTHGMDAAMTQPFSSPLFDFSTVVVMFYTQSLASHVV